MLAIQAEELQLADEEMVEMLKLIHGSSPPKEVTPVPRLFDDLRALQAIFNQPNPPEVMIWVSKVMLVFDRFGDASGKGSGSTILRDDGLSF